MARVVESSRVLSDRIFFELDHFELTAGDRLELRGRWFGVRGRRFMRPTLMLNAGDEWWRSLADLEHKPWQTQDGEPWEASFPCDVSVADVSQAELSVAPDIAVALPAPGGRSDTPQRLAAHSDRERVVAASGGGAEGEPPPDPLELARRDIDRLKAEAQALGAAREEALTERDQIAAERDQIAAERDQALAERNELRGALATAQAALGEAGAAVARGESERDQALAGQSELTAQHDQAIAELTAQRDSASAELANALSAHAQLAAERDEAVRAHAEASRLGDEALAARDQALAELQLQRENAERVQAEREAEMNARGAAMVMKNATRAAPLERRSRWRKRS